MPKLSRIPISEGDLGNYINNLWAAFTLADSKEDIKLLFKDLFTHTEYKMLAKRFEIARRLVKKEHYNTIERALRVTPVTISRISNVLAEKGLGLKKAIQKVNRLEEQFWLQRREYTKNLENPLRKKVKDHNKTVLGTALKGGVLEIEKKFSKHLKNKTAIKHLDI